MSKKISLSIGILVIIALIAISAFLLYQKSQSVGSRYTVTNTAYRLVSLANPDFRQGANYLDEKNYIAARQSYEKALSVAQDQTQKNLANYYIGLTYERGGEYAKAIQIYKQIAATDGGYGRQEAIQAIGEMYYIHPEARAAIVSETFKDEPYSSFKSGSDNELAYRKLYEYAVSIYPIGLSEARIAYWYANDVATKLKATTTPQAMSEIDIVKQSIAKADADMQKNDQSNSVEKVFDTSIYVLEGRALGKLASVGVGSAADAEAAFKKAVALADASGTYGIVRYRYAEYLANTFGAKRRTDIQELLSVFVTGSTSRKLTPEVQTLFRGARTEQVFSSAKKSLVKLAQIDPAFKTYLISLGWHEADFK